MKTRKERPGLTRRELLRYGGQGMVALALGGVMGIGGAGMGRRLAAATQDPNGVYVHLAATDGLMLTPDNPDGHYIFGFTDKVHIPQRILDIPSPSLRRKRIAGYLAGFKGKARLTAPDLIATQGQHLYVTLTNIGLVTRPDLDDSHTIHFHGFPNATPIFDGVPDQTFAVPVNRNFTYYYNLREPGTYPYHCHFEDVEHIQMGMVGTIIVRPNLGPDYAYNDPTTRFDREFVMFISEMDSGIHDRLMNVQETQTDWSNYTADYWLLNGRSHPDTLRPNNDPGLPSQPVSSLVRANSGDRVLLRFVNLGYQEHSITLPGIPLRVVGEDAKLLRGGGNPGADLSYTKNVLNVEPGKTYDVIFEAPQVQRRTTFPLFDRNLRHAAGATSPGGMTTEVRVYPAGTLGPQLGPNR